MNPMPWSLVSLLVGLFVCVIGPVAASACPTCKEALFDPAQAQQVLKTSQGYALSIGLMIGMPVLLVGGLAMLIARHARRQGARTQTESELTP